MVVGIRQLDCRRKQRDAVVKYYSKPRHQLRAAIGAYSSAALLQINVYLNDLTFSCYIVEITGRK